MGESGMHQHLSQRLVAGAGMQRRLSILQASGMELDHLIREIVDSNPVLEMQSSEELVSIELINKDSEDGSNEWDEGDGFECENEVVEKYEDYYYQSIATSKTLASSLREQAAYCSFPPEMERALYIMIDSLDERGFFEEDPTIIVARYGFSEYVGNAALAALRDMEPSGVGAVDVRNSLLLQLSREGEGDSLAARLIESCWDDLAKHRYEEASVKLGVEGSDVQASLDRIRRLNPDPGVVFRSESNPYIMADVIVERNEGGEWDVRLTGAGVPALSVNDDYKEILAESSNDSVLRDYLKKAFSEARELMNEISSRQETILKLTWILVSLQKNYFNQGLRGLKPLGMDVVAREMEVNISTISRAVSGKYLLGPWGYKELRSFFSSGVDSHEGDKEGKHGMAKEAVQSLIFDLIKREDGAHPLSDATIAERLNLDHGLKISRRTVAKYRDQMKVLPASLRKG